MFRTIVQNKEHILELNALIGLLLAKEMILLKIKVRRKDEDKVPIIYFRNMIKK